MKSFTDIEQSKKLAEILSLESADMCYPYDRHLNKMYGDIPYVMGYKRFNESTDIPCWSLAALLEIIPSHLGEFKDNTDFGLSKSFNGKWYSAHYLKRRDDGDLLSSVYVKTGDTSIDACYEMILELHKNKLI